MRISDWSSDVCSSDLVDDIRLDVLVEGGERDDRLVVGIPFDRQIILVSAVGIEVRIAATAGEQGAVEVDARGDVDEIGARHRLARGEAQHDLIRQRSEEHTSELQSLMRISYAVFC